MNFTFLPWSTFHRTGPCSAHQRGSQPGNPHTSSETKHQVTGVWVKMQNSSWNPLPDKLILILIELRSELKSIFYIGSDRTVMSHYFYFLSTSMDAWSSWVLVCRYCRSSADSLVLLLHPPMALNILMLALSQPEHSLGVGQQLRSYESVEPGAW